jgi:hypothetical protein
MKKVTAKQISFGATNTVKSAMSLQRPITRLGANEKSYNDEAFFDTLCYSHKLNPHEVRIIRNLFSQLWTVAGPNMPHAKYAKTHIELDHYIEGIPPDGHGNSAIGTGSHLTGVIRRFF